MSKHQPLLTAVVGAGSMGEHHARVVSASQEARLGVVVDIDPARAAKVASAHGARPSSDLADALTCDAAVISTPTERHREIAEELLRSGIPVLVEKPLAENLGSVESMLDTASTAGTPLMCGFVERFNPVVLTAMAAVGSAEVRHIVGLRHSPPAPRVQVDVVQDMLIHDLDLACRFASGPDIHLSAEGWCPKGNGVLEIADAVVRFEGTLAHLSADRWSQHKIRTLSISTDDALYEMDLLRQTMTVYRHRSETLAADGSYRSETALEIPFIRQAGEPLALQWQRFADLVRERLDWETELQSYASPHRLAAAVVQQASNAKAG